jgi:O-antigen ligase
VFLLLGALQRAPRSLAPPRLLLFFALVAASHVLSILTSSNPALSWSASVYAPFALLIFLAAQVAITTPEAWRRLAMVFGVVVALLSLDGAYQAISGTSMLTGQLPFALRVRGSVPHPNDIALVPLLVPFVLSVVVERRGKALSVMAALCLPLAMVTLAGSRSRNAWLGLAVAVVVWMFAAHRRRLGLMVLLSGAVLFGLGLAFDLGGLRERMASLLTLQRGGRLGVWLVAWEMFKEAPILGQGVHVFDDFYPAYLERVSLPDGYQPEVAYIPWAHSIYLELLAERGLVGFLAFGALIAAMVRRTVGAVRGAVSEPQRLYAAALAGSLASFLMMGIFDLTFLKDWVSLMFWLLAALCARIDDAFTSAAEPVPSSQPS